MKRTVVLVDDDRRLLNQYSEWLAESGVSTRAFYGVDGVLEYLRAGHPADVIVWDMMMVPGKEFEGREHGGGFSTGLLLYAEMKKLRPTARFILLTNKDDRYISLRGEDAVICMKTETTPADLADLVESLMTGDPADSEAP